MAARRPAIEERPEVHLHFHGGMSAEEVTAIIRQQGSHALPIETGERGGTTP
jgi:hypothetical protein